MKFKKIAEYTGKTLATIVCPPVGLALWGKKERGTAFLSGMLLSMLSTIYPAVLSGDEIYDNPPMVRGRQPISSVRTILGGCFSPLAFYVDGTTKATTLILNNNEREHVIYSIEGYDAVSFQNGRYRLNFGKDRRFRAGDRFSWENVEEAEKQVERLQRTLDDYVSEGNISKARQVREKLTRVQNRLQETLERYNQTRTAFQEAIDKMNSELEILARTGTQD